MARGIDCPRKKHIIEVFNKAEANFRSDSKAELIVLGVALLTSILGFWALAANASHSTPPSDNKVPPCVQQPFNKSMLHDVESFRATTVAALIPQPT